MTMIPAKHHDGEGKGKREKGRKEEMNRREWKVSLGEGRLTNDCDAHAVGAGLSIVVDSCKSSDQEYLTRYFFLHSPAPRPTSRNLRSPTIGL